MVHELTTNKINTTIPTLTSQPPTKIAQFLYCVQHSFNIAGGNNQLI